MPRFSRVSAFILFGFFLLSCVFSPAAIALEPLGPVSSYGMEEYWYWPTYHPTVESALGALKNLQGKVVGWQGSYVTQWDADAYGLRALGTVVEVQQSSLFFSNTVQVPQVESTVIPFEEVTGLHLVHVFVDRQYTLGVRCDLKTGMQMFRVPDYGTATQVYNALASLVAASGRSITFPTLGAYFRDITEKDLWIPGLKEAKGMIVTGVMKGSPAEKGDLRVRDAVVLCNDQPVENFAQWSEKIKPGAKSFDFKVLRKSTPPAVCHVVLPPDDLYPKPPRGLAFAASKSPVPAQPSTQQPSQAAAAEAPVPPKMGFSLRYPSEAEKSILGGRTGAVIVEMVPGGLAEKALLRVNDILLECNGKPVTAPETLGSLLIPGENLFLVKRNGQDMTVKVGATLVSY